MSKLKVKKELIQTEGKIKEILTIHDEKGKVLKRVFRPLMVEFHPKDLVQVIVGSAILAIPVGFTEETWRLGEQLPITNVLIFLLLSIGFLSVFTYYNYYRGRMREHYSKFFMRVISTYVFSFIVVAGLLTLIQRTPWSADWILAFKRVTIVAFPSSMSAAVADMIK